MGRPSKLSPDQWADIEKRLLAGEGASELAREFKVHPAQITRRLSQVTQNVRNVAQMIAESQTALAELPVAQQYNALSLADKLRSISNSLASGAELSAKNYHRVTALANAELQRVDDAEPMSETSLAALKNVAALTKLGNDAAQTPINLLAANKDAVKRINGEAEDEEAVEKPRGVLVVPGMMADTAAWAAAAQKASLKAGE